MSAAIQFSSTAMDRVCYSRYVVTAHDFTNITMGNTTLTVREPLERIKDVIQNGS